MWEQIDGVFKLKRASLKYLEKANRIPVEEYLKKQGRFKLTTEQDIQVIQEWVDKNWKRIARTIDSE